MRGSFILIEGCDRSGKTTQVAELVSRLKEMGQNVTSLSFPNRSTDIGQVINAYLQQNINLSLQTSHLLFSANRWESSTALCDLLEAGTIVVMDRYVYSGLAFSIAQGLDPEWAKMPDRGLPKPDLIIYLNANLDLLAQRGGYGLERYENRQLQERVAEAYRSVLSEVKTKCVVVDAAEESRSVASKILTTVLSKIDLYTKNPILRIE